MKVPKTLNYPLCLMPQLDIVAGFLIDMQRALDFQLRGLS
jgi:hypothetical protein